MAVSLFEKYGGFATISKIVMSFYDKAIDSDEIGPYFDDIDMRRLIDHQTKFVSSLCGGPASYTDEQLRRTHAHLAIDHDSFAEMARLLETTLNEHGMERADVAAVMSEIRRRENVIVSA